MFLFCRQSIQNTPCDNINIFVFLYFHNQSFEIWNRPGFFYLVFFKLRSIIEENGSQSNAWILAKPLKNPPLFDLGKIHPMKQKNILSNLLGSEFK